MNTLKSFRKRTVSVNFIICVLYVILLSGCSKDDNPTETLPSHVGTYTLTSISSNFGLDPNVTGQFNDNELIDNISCSSTITLNTDNSFSWDFLRIMQDDSSLFGTGYERIRCSTPSKIGEFEIDDTQISLDVEGFSTTRTGLLNENSIEILITEELIVEGGVLGHQREQANLTLIYEK